MTAIAQDLSSIIHSVRAADKAEGDRLAHDMIAAGLAYLRIHRGARACAELCDGLAEDFTADVLNQPARSSR
jgi:hypothetical protein